MSTARRLPRSGHAAGAFVALSVLGTGLNLTGAAALPWWLVLAPLWVPLVALLLLAGLVAWCGRETSDD